MGSLEDRYRDEERRHEAKEVAEHNKLVDEINEMLPKITRYLRNKQPMPAGYWVEFNGESRIAWLLGHWGDDWEGDFLLLPEEGELVVTRAYIHGSSSTKPLHVSGVITYRHIKTGELKERYVIPGVTDNLRDYIGPHPKFLHKELRYLLPETTEKKRKRWWK